MYICATIFPVSPVTLRIRLAHTRRTVWEQLGAHDKRNSIKSTNYRVIKHKFPAQPTLQILRLFDIPFESEFFIWVFLRDVKTNWKYIIFLTNQTDKLT